MTTSSPRFTNTTDPVQAAYAANTARLESEFRQYGDVETVAFGDYSGVSLRVERGYLTHEQGRALVKKFSQHRA